MLESIRFLATLARSVQACALGFGGGYFTTSFLVSLSDPGEPTLERVGLSFAAGSSRLCSISFCTNQAGHGGACGRRRPHLRTRCHRCRQDCSLRLRVGGALTASEICSPLLPFNARWASLFTMKALIRHHGVCGTCAGDACALILGITEMPYRAY